jgi:mannan endo-1,6-alpha-mannosidase
MMGSLLDYGHYTGDISYNAITAQAILAQKGAGNDFMGPSTDGNDDQGWWALTAMSAAEYGLPAPAGAPSWLSIAQNVFTEFTQRWDTTRCNGGMKWKIQPGAPGYHYKSSIANGVFFQLAARLAKFTNNQDYANWADKSFVWMQSVGLIDNQFNIFDGTDDAKTTGCPDVNHDQWSYNAGVFLYGSAVMQDFTGGDKKWVDRVNGILGRTKDVFFPNGKPIMVEIQCEPKGNCDIDQQSFKAYLSRWLTATAFLLPATRAVINPLLSGSAMGAATACAGPNGMCGSRWFTGNFDGVTGVGQQMGALDVMNGLLVPPPPAPSPPKLPRRLRLKPLDFVG